MDTTQVTAPQEVTLCAICQSCVDPLRHVRCHKDGFAILQCPECGLVFRGTSPDDEELARIYADEYFFSEKGETEGQGYLDYIKDEEFFRTNAKRRLTEINKRQSSPGSLLDVGCAAGFFMDEARNTGWNVRGVEYSPTMAAWARDQLGLDVAVGKFQEFDTTPESFSLVTMWDYLEHSIDPVGDLKKAYELLQPGGLLVLSTGDIRSLAARFSGRRWHLLTPRHHLYYFSPPPLVRCLQDQNFTVLSRSYPSDKYSVRYVSHKLYTMLPFSWLKKLAKAIDRSRVGGFLIPINLFDIMTIHARK